MIFYKAALIKRGTRRLLSSEHGFLSDSSSLHYYRGYRRRGCWRMGDSYIPLTYSRSRRRNI